MGETASWLGQIIHEMSVAQLGDLLYFATAARCLPSANATGAHVTFVHAPNATDDHLPISHTCFNTVDLPLYSSLEVLRTKLLHAMDASLRQGGFQLG